MAQAEPRRANYADIEALPPNVVGEIVFGVLRTYLRPLPLHALATHRLQTVLGGPFGIDPECPGGWIFLDEPELHLGEHIIVPDIAGWRRETLPIAAVHEDK